ncbi:hypothetical protein WK24_18415 [Burkholderia vietnamiensis]|jgi:hypothetical protein|nr:hypothetical protein WK24_18415 [Burkholderia vietnamiensis]
MHLDEAAWIVRALHANVPNRPTILRSDAARTVVRIRCGHEPVAVNCDSASRRASTGVALNC